MTRQVRIVALSIRPGLAPIRSGREGHGGGSRRRIERILALDDSDSDALVQLGALDVRTDQPALARWTFRQCLESRQGAKWRWEIHWALAKIGDGS